MCLFAARGRRAVPVRNGAGRPSKGDPQEVHLRRDIPLQADERRRVDWPVKLTFATGTTSDYAYDSGPSYS